MITLRAHLMNRLTFASIALVVLLSGCQSPQTTPSTPSPPSMPSPSSPSSSPSMPSPSSPSSSPSMPSPSSRPRRPACQVPQARPRRPAPSPSSPSSSPNAPPSSCPGEKTAHVSQKRVGTKPPHPIKERQANQEQPGDSASSEDLINAGEAFARGRERSCTRGAQDAEDPLCAEPMSDASGGDRGCAHPRVRTHQPADEETFFETTQRAPVLRQRKPRLWSSHRTAHLRRVQRQPPQPRTRLTRVVRWAIGTRMSP